MAIKKKVVKKAVKKAPAGSYFKKIAANPKVKSATMKVKEAEKKVVALKKLKAAAVKVAQKSYKSKKC